jgi:hypothetical protein
MTSLGLDVLAVGVRIADEKGPCPNGSSLLQRRRLSAFGRPALPLKWREI